jgi:hypothetical protein
VLATASKVLAATGIAVLTSVALGSPAATADAGDTGCVVYPLGTDDVIVHEQRSATSPVTGFLRPNQATGGGCGLAPGGHYVECGGGSTWVTVARAGLRGFVPLGCVEIVS